MTKQQAINVMEKYTVEPISKVVVRAHKFAIRALKELKDNGFWVKDNPSQIRYVHTYRCSECNRHISGIPLPYCPYCGSKMDAEIVENNGCETCESGEVLVGLDPCKNYKFANYCPQCGRKLGD